MQNAQAEMQTPLGFLNGDPIASLPCLKPCGDRPEESSSIPGGTPGPRMVFPLLLSPARGPDAPSAFISPRGHVISL